VKGFIIQLTTALLLSLVLVSCQPKNNGCDASNETCLFNVGAEEELQDGEVPNEALTFDTNLTLVNFNPSQQDKIFEAAEIIKQVIASNEFKEAVINHTYNGKKTFVDNGGLSNTQIYQRLLKGAEKLTPTINNAMDAELELYYEPNSTVGYTRPNTKRIWINTKFFDGFTPAQVAGNLSHEWMHKLGFGHSSVENDARAFSVPYAIGYLINRLSFLGQ